MKRISLYVVALLCSLSAVGATTFDFSSSIPAGWTASVAPRGYEAERGTQFDQSSTLTLSGVSNVTEVIIVASSNYDKDPNYYTLSVTVGNNAFGSPIKLPKVTNETYTFAGVSSSGDLVVTIAKNGKKSMWIKSITVEGEVPEAPDPTDRLDKDYVYNEPEMILPVEELGKMAFDTVINNILLTCAQGAFYKTDIRVMANASLTLTATKPIKAIRVDGGVRKSFSAETNAGDLSYYSSDEGDIESAPVLLIKDVNNETVTLTCFAQLRMEKLYVYFEDNPAVEIEMEEDPEPLAGCTVTSSTGEWNFVTSYVDTEFLWTIGTTKIHLVSNPEWQLYTDGYIYGDGSGVYLELDFYPDDILYDWSGTYTKESGKLTDYCYGYLYYIGEGDDDDVWEGFYFVDGSSITLTANGDTYDLEYSLVDTYNVVHAGTVKGICKEAAQPMAIENIEVGLDTQAPMFNILGQPVDGSFRGIIIQNNRKYLLLP